MRIIAKADISQFTKFLFLSIDFLGTSECSVFRKNNNSSTYLTPLHARQNTLGCCPCTSHGIFKRTNHVATIITPITQMEEAEGKRGTLTGQVSYYTVADLTFALRSS